MRFLLPLLLLAVGCAPESPEAVARRQFTNLRSGYIGYAENLLTPQTRGRVNSSRVRHDSLHGKPPFMGEMVVDMMVGATTLQADAFAFDVLETRIEGDTARLVVRRQWPDSRALSQHQNPVFQAERDSLAASLKSRARTPRSRRIFEQMIARHTATVIASDPARYVRTDTATYVLVRQMNVWRIVDDDGLLTAPTVDSALAAADIP